MVSVDAADNVDTTHLVTQLLLQILPTSATPSNGCCNSDAHPTSVPVCTEAGDDIKKTELTQLQAREQAGCHLWDMTSSEGPARVAVQHAALEILPKVAVEALSQNQPRMAELLTGALANIICHRTLAEQVS